MFPFPTTRKKKVFSSSSKTFDDLKEVFLGVYKGGMHEWEGKEVRIRGE
jgi:hypothetical protein